MAVIPKNPYSKIEDNAIFTASKEELTLMLYEGALKFINQAIDATENQDMQKANGLIIRVEDIIREFQMTLDFKYEISNQLNSLYDYMHRRLIESNMSKDIGIMTEVRDMLREFRNMWKEAMNMSKAAVV
ncbi:MAG: flagellar export chaperone FliS [Clostridiales bacterium]|jgi:flagellar protein FliS|nr:flagellar export chaperone FliS [Clostridiales bacterium]